LKVAVDLTRAKPRLVEPRDFGQFRVEVSGTAESPENWLRLGALLESQAIGRLADEVARVRLDWLCSAGPSTDADWCHGLSRMLHQARSRGWVDDEDGSVSAHVTWVTEDAISLSEAHYRHVLGHFASGLAIVAAATPFGPAGFTCQSFSGVSIDPPLVLFCPGVRSTTWPRLREVGAVSVNVLAAEQAELGRNFARGGLDRFNGVGWRPGPVTGAPIIDGTLAWLECRINAEYPAGDHHVVLGRVLAMDGVEREPLIFFRGALHDTFARR
jgi:3-hydroxy-9,10-secoandrosta-1,3,5(10)-triene-9,17-dione monooxygenase reductase component